MRPFMKMLALLVSSFGGAIAAELLGLRATAFFAGVLVGWWGLYWVLKPDLEDKK